MLQWYHCSEPLDQDDRRIRFGYMAKHAPNRCHLSLPTETKHGTGYAERSSSAATLIEFDMPELHAIQQSAQIESEHPCIAGPAHTVAFSQAP